MEHVCARTLVPVVCDRVGGRTRRFSPLPPHAAQAKSEHLCRWQARRAAAPTTSTQHTQGLVSATISSHPAPESRIHSHPPAAPREIWLWHPHSVLHLMGYRAARGTTVRPDASAQLASRGSTLAAAQVRACPPLAPSLSARCLCGRLWALSPRRHDGPSPPATAPSPPPLPPPPPPCMPPSPPLSCAPSASSRALTRAP